MVYLPVTDADTNEEKYWVVSEETANKIKKHLELLQKDFDERDETFHKNGRQECSRQRKPRYTENMTQTVK